MKFFNFALVFTAFILLTGCQSLQFVESPIPVTSYANQTPVSSDHTMIAAQ